MVDGPYSSDRAQIWLDSKSTDKICFSFWDGEPFLVDFFIPAPDHIEEIDTLKRFRADIDAIINEAESKL